MKLSPQEERVFALLKSYAWCDETMLRAAINEPDGTPRWTPSRVIISKIRKAVAPHGFTIESAEIHRGKRGGRCKYRLIAPQSDRAAAA